MRNQDWSSTAQGLGTEIQLRRLSAGGGRGLSWGLHGLSWRAPRASSRPRLLCDSPPLTAARPSSVGQGFTAAQAWLLSQRNFPDCAHLLKNTGIKSRPAGSCLPVTELGLSDGSQTRPSGISKPTGLPSRFRSQGREDGVSVCVTTEPRACVASGVWRPRGSLRAPALTELSGLRGDREGQGQRG